ncbi:dynamin family protein [Paenibacillus sp.]|uniref:dynamin family protein n=1 Tax=Paenibacillus sp. TaxID=58172 RepID=UPI0028125D6B|nr:dynamin family protein [Paenibacillus sp.]
MSLWDKVRELALDDFDPRNRYIADRELGILLMARLVRGGEKPTELDQALAQLEDLLTRQYPEDFGGFQVPNDASLYAEVQRFLARLKQAAAIPELAGRQVVAIGGGFSAGKSHLINSIIGTEVLPVDTTPTTSTATYVVSGKPTMYKARNIFNRNVLLDEAAIQAVTHAFTEQYRLNLSPLLRHMLIQVEGRGKGYPFAILDTPGYSRSDAQKRTEERDETIARLALTQADQIIWVIDIERGVIPQDDLRFIRSLGWTKDIFFVLNKADAKTEEQIKQVLKTVKDTLKENAIPFSGVAAYSSKKQIDYAPDKLTTFLKRLAKEKKQPVHWLGDFEAIVERYKQYAEQAVEQNRTQLKKLNEEAIFAASEKEKKLLSALIQEKRQHINGSAEKLRRYESVLQPYRLKIVQIEKLLIAPSDPGGDVLEELQTAWEKLLHELLDRKPLAELTAEAERLALRFELAELPAAPQFQGPIYNRLEELFSRTKSAANAFEHNRPLIEELLHLRHIELADRELHRMWTRRCEAMAEGLKQAARKLLHRFVSELAAELPANNARAAIRDRLYASLRELSDGLADTLQAHPTEEARFPLPERLSGALIPEAALPAAEELLRSELVRYGTGIAASLDASYRQCLLTYLKESDSRYD